MRNLVLNCQGFGPNKIFLSKFLKKNNKIKNVKCIYLPEYLLSSKCV